MYACVYVCGCPHRVYVKYMEGKEREDAAKKGRSEEKAADDWQ